MRAPHVTAQTDISHPAMPRTTSHVLLAALPCLLLLCLQNSTSLARVRDYALLPKSTLLFNNGNG